MPAISGGSNLYTASQILKTLFEGDKVVGQYIEATKYLNTRKAKTVDLGLKVVNAVEAYPGQGIGIVAENGALPTPTPPVYQNPTWDVIHNYFRVQVSGQLWRKSLTDQGAFASGLSLAFSSTMKQFMRDNEFQALNDGTGIRTVVGVVTVNAGGTITITSATGYNVRGLWGQMNVDIIDPTTGAVLDTQQVTDVSYFNNTVTIAGTTIPGGVPVNAYICRQGGYGVEMNGIDSLVNNASGPATVLGLASSQSWWQSVVLANGGIPRQLTPNLVDQAMLYCKLQNGEMPDEIWVDLYTYRSFLEAQTRVVTFANTSGGSMGLNLGNRVQDWNTAKVEDSDCVKPNRAYFLQGGDIALNDIMGITFITEPDGENVWFKVEGYDMYECQGVWEPQQTLMRRNLHAQLQDILVPTV